MKKNASIKRPCRSTDQNLNQHFKSQINTSKDRPIDRSTIDKKMEQWIKTYVNRSKEKIKYKDLDQHFKYEINRTNVRS